MPYKIDVCGIYKIINKQTNHCYVGQSTRAKKRIKEHFRLLRLNKHPNQHLQNSYNKYGHDSFYGEIEIECEDPSDLDMLEELFLMGDAFFEQPCLYNISDSAKAPMRGKSHNQEVRKRISEGRRASTFNFSSQEYKKTLSDAQLARYRADPKFVERLRFIVNNTDMTYAERARHVGVCTSSARKMAIKYGHLKGLI
jgi:group I intron endonuclease